ncbi:hypothetical protein LCGC14_1561970 [marine sediment metagenome]|uniref:HNH nuclease domain-containing protein n=1 Tax=marine sediment metagenome TaxID=412755 RepID=A0A0F9LMZ5_9ZZZZ
MPRIEKQIVCPSCKRGNPGGFYKLERLDENTMLQYRKCRFCGFEWRREKAIYALPCGGYRYIQVPSGENVSEHRYVWEQHYGKISEGFVIHHINGNQQDNTIGNLIALPHKKHNSHLAKQNLARVFVACPSCGAKFPYLQQLVDNDYNAIA